MKVTLNYMGQLRYLSGKDSEQIDCAGGRSLSEMLTEVSKAYDQRFVDVIFDSAGDLRPSLMIVVNDKTADKELTQSLSDGDSVTLLTAIAGG